MKMVTTVLLASCMTAFAGFTPLAPKVVPLPDAEVGVIFGKIGKGEKIELAKLYQALNGPQTALRADAARELGKYGDKASVPYLIDALSDESTHVGGDYPEAGMATTRYWANDSMKKLTAKDFGFVWNDPIEKRNQAIAKWREWFQKEMKTEPTSAGDVLKAAPEK
ncbi:MAG: HEAT repeat domain-containing protein [bacterium]